MVKTEVVLHEEPINYIKFNKLQLDKEYLTLLYLESLSFRLPALRINFIFRNAESLKKLELYCVVSKYRKTYIFCKLPLKATVASLLGN